MSRDGTERLEDHVAEGWRGTNPRQPHVQVARAANEEPIDGRQMFSFSG